MANEQNLKPWKKGQSGNPGGMTKKTKALLTRNAERASRLRARLLDSLEKAEGDPELTTELLRMLKDSEDRGYGAPKQEVGGDFNINVIKRADD